MGSGLDLDRLLRELDALATRIPPISKEIGVRYLNSGAVLEPLTNASDALTTHSIELLKLAIGQTDGDLVVNGTTDLLALPFAYLDSWRTGVQGYVAELTSCEDIFARLEASQADLNALVSPLEHIRTMFRIEAARLPEEVRQIFAGLTEQIAAVHNEVNETFAGQFHIVSQTLNSLEQVRRTISEHAEHLQQGLLERRQRVTEAMDKLRCELSKNNEREIELSKTSETVASSTTKVVIALQAHDICSQRLEHVSIALVEVRRILEGMRNGTERDKRIVQQAWCSLMVQGAQVEHVFKHFETSEASLQQAVQDILSKVLAFDDQCILLKEFQEVTVATNGSVELSLEMMEEVAELLTGVIKASKKVCESIQPVCEMTAGLTDALESLSTKMRLVALNAQVQAVLIGTGTGLEVLAAQTASISGETSVTAEKISVDIQSLIRVVQELTTSLQRITAEGEAALESFTADSATHEGVLHGLRNRTLHHLQLVGEAVDQISACTDGLHQDSQVRQAAVLPLDKLARDLREMSADMKRNLKHLDADTATNLQTNYKMRSERDVHRDVLAGLGVSGLSDEIPASPPNAEQTDTSIELF